MLLRRCSTTAFPSWGEFQETYASQATKQLAGIVKSSSEVTQVEVVCLGAADFFKDK